MDDVVRGFGGSSFSAVETADFDKIAQELDPIEQFKRRADPMDLSRYDIKVRYKRFDLDNDEQREELERIQTSIATVDGVFPEKREEWTALPDGRMLVTLCWVEMTPKSEKKNKQKKKAS